MIFLINYLSFIRQLFPYFLRQPKTFAMLTAIAKPLQTINDSFVTFRNDMIFRLAFNTQIIYLEKYLNTVYPNPFVYPANIHILDGANISYFYLYNKVENQSPVYFHNHGETFNPLYFRNYSEQVAGTFSFIVRIPTYCQSNPDFEGLTYSENLVKKRINFYNLAGKTYEIQYF